jgi:hypothetical protein
MKRRLVLSAGGLTVAVSLLILSLALAARPDDKKGDDEAAPKTAASKITQVTIYPNSALVTREVEVPGGTGSFELVVNPLPEHTINSSLYSESADGIRVLTTRFRTRPVREDAREGVAKLENTIKTLQQEGARIQAEIEACTQNMALLGKLENFTSASTTHATEKGKLDADATMQLAKYLMEGRADKTKELVALRQKLDDNKEKLDFAIRDMRDKTKGSSRTERDAVIVVDKTNAAAGKVKLNYLVDAATWKPQYKLRAGKTNKDPVQVECLAAIVQQTGEDWSGVNIILSTAEPMLNAAPPELRVLAVNVVPKGMDPNQLARELAARAGNGRPGDNRGFVNPSYTGTAGNKAEELTKQAQAVRQQAQGEFNKRNIDNANDLQNYAAALDQARDLVVAEVQNKDKLGQPRAAKLEGPSVTYHLNAKLSVPSRNDEQAIEMARIELAPEYYYKAVPVLTSHVYRQADLTNTSKYVLLPGEATMYNGADFVGRMSLPLVAIGEQFTVGFGTDPQLQVTRTMMDKTKAMKGGNQELKFEYRILVSSYKSEKVKVQIWDRLPAAENETMGISLVKTTPELCKDDLYVREERSQNLLRWDVDVEPEMKGAKALAINYEFKLELDKNSTIGSFLNK